MKARAVLILGWALLVFGVGLVVVGTIGVAITDGWWAALQLFSPYNIANFVATVAAVGPGMLLIAWGRNLRSKRTKPN